MNENQYFDDLSVYTHQIYPYVLSGVFNVGWLNPKLDIPQGLVPAGFFEKLLEIANAKGKFNGLVEPIRELPYCAVCGEIAIKTNTGKNFLNSELWIPSGERIYAAPISIIHLIQKHGYAPPSEYIEAVFLWNDSIDFNGNITYQKKLKESDWFKRQREN